MSQIALDILAAKYSNVAAAATTVVKSGQGFLKRIVVNKALANGTITIYDNTAGSGTKIGTITFPATLLANQFVFDYECAFSTGLTVVSVEDVDFTVVYA